MTLFDGGTIDGLSVHFVVFHARLTRGTTLHCGANSGHFQTSVIHCPTSSGVSEESERSGTRERSEQCKRSGERVAQCVFSVCILGCSDPLC